MKNSIITVSRTKLLKVTNDFKVGWNHMFNLHEVVCAVNSLETATDKQRLDFDIKYCGNSFNVQRTDSVEFVD